MLARSSSKFLKHAKLSLCALCLQQQNPVQMEMKLNETQRNNQFVRGDSRFFSTTKFVRQEEQVHASDESSSSVNEHDNSSDESSSVIQSKLLGWMLQAIVQPNTMVAIKMLVPYPILFKKEYREYLMSVSGGTEVNLSQKAELFPGTEYSMLSVRGEAQKVFLVMGIIIHKMFDYNLSLDEPKKPFYIRVFFPEFLRSQIVGPGRSVQNEICDQSGVQIMSTQREYAIIGTPDRLFRVVGYDADSILHALILMTGKVQHHKGYQVFINAPLSSHTEAHWMGILYSQFPKYRMLRGAQYNVDINLQPQVLRRVLPGKGSEIEQLCEYQYDEKKGRLTLQGNFMEVVTAQALLEKKLSKLNEYIKKESNKSKSSLEDALNMDNYMPQDPDKSNPTLEQYLQTKHFKQEQNQKFQDEQNQTLNSNQQNFEDEENQTLNPTT